MKTPGKAKVVLLHVFILVFISAKSQNCSYSVTNNYNVAMDTDIVFKTITFYNTKLLRYDTMDLKMDIIKPIGDNNTKRPIIVYFHGMNESYKYSQLHVKRMVDVMVKERGFIVASVDFKFWALPYVEPSPANCGNLLFLLNEIYSPYDIAESKRSNYRVVQDANDAIKYVKSRTITDSSCSNLCFIAGFSAGGLIAGSTALMSVSEKPVEAGNISPATYTNLFGTALSPTVSLSRPDLGNVYGLTNTYPPSIKGLMLFNSGLYNKALIQQNDLPLFIYHSLNDPNIPADSSSPACFTDSKIYGQNVLKNQALNEGYILGQNLILTNGNTNHDFFNTQIRLGADFMNNQILQAQCLCDSSTIAAISEKRTSDFNIYSFNNKIILQNNNIYNKLLNLIIYDMLGKKIASEKFLFNNYKEYIVNTSSGMYFIEIRSDDINVSKKIMILND